MYIAIWYDTLNKSYLCSPHPFFDVEEAIYSMDDPEGERYELCQTIKVFK